MKASIRKFDVGKEYYFAEGCFITELSNSCDDPELSIARARVEPGKTTLWHRLHETSERYVIIEGTGVVEIDDLPPEEVNPGDVVIIPPGSRQRINNTGSGDLVFLALCSPRFSEDVYEGLDG